MTDPFSSRRITWLVGVSQSGRLHLRHVAFRASISGDQIGRLLKKEDDRVRGRITRVVGRLFWKRVIATIPKEKIIYGLGSLDLERGNAVMNHAVRYNPTERNEGLTQALRYPARFATDRDFAKHFPALAANTALKDAEIVVVLSQLNRVAVAIALMLDVALSVSVGVGMSLLKQSVGLGLAVGLPILFVLILVKAGIFVVSG